MQKDVTTSWSNFYTGRKVIIETATALTDSSVKCEAGVTVRAASGNSGYVYVGKSTVTKNSAESTDGYELAAGQSITIPVNNVNKVYAIASVNPQTVYWMAA
jgi:hypothetical protein